MKIDLRHIKQLQIPMNTQMKTSVDFEHYRGFKILQYKLTYQTNDYHKAIFNGKYCHKWLVVDIKNNLIKYFYSKKDAIKFIQEM